ncbi:MAG: hypothetical protein WDA22_02660 [Bacteroidota bacterium]
MDKKERNPKPQKTANKNTKNSMPVNIVEIQKVENSSGNKSNTNKPNDEIKNSLWNKIKEKPDQWLLVFLTFSIVVTGVVQTCVYRDSTHVDLRAYIGIDKFRLNQFAADQELVVAYDIINTGKTPARETKYWGTIKIGGTGVYESEFDAMKRGKYTGTSSPSIPNGVPVPATINSNIILNASQISDIKDGKMNIFAYSRCEYIDIFGEKHFADFCYSYKPGRGFYIFGEFNGAN